MEFEEKDTELINLLAMIKSADGEYPEDLLAPRRQRFMKQLAEIGAFAGLGIGFKSSPGGKPSMPPIATSLVETMLVIAIVAEVGAVAFINRDKLTEIFRIISKEPRVEQISTPVNPVLMPIEVDITNTSYSTQTVTATSTPSPDLSPTPTLDAARVAVTEGTPQATSTPDPKDNNGNHYGQTPKPERTKDNGNDTKPKDPKKTKEPKDPKPTKKPKGK